MSRKEISCQLFLFSASFLCELISEVQLKPWERPTFYAAVGLQDISVCENGRCVTFGNYRVINCCHGLAQRHDGLHLAPEASCLVECPLLNLEDPFLGFTASLSLHHLDNCVHAGFISSSGALLVSVTEATQSNAKHASFSVVMLFVVHYDTPQGTKASIVTLDYSPVLQRPDWSIRELVSP